MRNDPGLRLCCTECPPTDGIISDTGDGGDDMTSSNEGFITRMVKFASKNENDITMVHSKGLLFHDLRFLEHPVKYFNC